MKILYIIHSCIMGGATISFINLVKGIRSEGFEVIVAHPRPSKDEKILIDELTNLGCKCIPIRTAVSAVGKSKSPIKTVIKFIFYILKILVFKVISYRNLSKVVNNEKPDIIHTNTGVVHEGFWISKKYNLPHIWHLREYQTKDFNMAVFPSLKSFKKNLKESYTVCITKDIQDFFGLKDYRKSFVIYNPAMFESEILSTGKKENYFLVANRISPEKGINDILKSFSLIVKSRPDYLLKIAGFGGKRYIAELKNLCAELGIENNVLFLGYSDNIRSLMIYSKALIVGSYYEGFGRMTAEANMLGIPVIGRNSAGTKEVLEQTHGGFLFNSVPEMAERMNILADYNDEKIDNLMKEPQQTAINLFSGEQHIRKMIALYKRVVL